MCDCNLCSELKEQKTSPEVKRFFEDSRIFAENENFCLFPTVGCFVKGYTLLATKEHYISLYNCPDDIVLDVKKTVGIISDQFKERFNSDMIFFEHGTVNDYNLSSASVCHFHMHFLPINESIWQKIKERYSFKYYEILDLTEVKSLVDKYKVDAYLLLGDIDKKIYLIDCTNEDFPSQFLRKVLYEYYYGKTEDEKWNWKRFPFYEIMEETLQAMDGMKL